MYIRKILLGKGAAACVLLMASTITQISCIAKETPASSGAALARAQSAAQDQQPAQQNQQSAPQDQAANQGQQSFTPDQLDELMAPIALYPDALLAQILMASKNPQEVLDAGNWLGQQKPELKGDELDKASKAAGFTPSAQALMHFKDVLDMMCQELDWTKQMGQAVNADQKAVMDSVQRLRAQAVDVGSLKTNDKQKVEVKEENGSTVVVVQPANPQVIYVPQYNPQTVYVAPATTGVSTGTAVTASVLSFGAGLAIGSLFNHNYYPYPSWGGGGFYYPRGGAYYPPPYRPAYGGGWGYSSTYRRPAYYGNNNLVVHNNNYYGRFNGNQNRSAGYHTNSLVRPTNPNGLVAKRPEYRGGGNNANINRSNTVNRNNTVNVDKSRTTTAAGNRAGGTGTGAGANAAGNRQIPTREQANAAAAGRGADARAAAGSHAGGTGAGGNAAGSRQLPSREQASAAAAGRGAGGDTTPPAINANRGTGGAARANAGTHLPAGDAGANRAAATSAAQSRSGGDRGFGQGGHQAPSGGQAKQARQANPSAFGGGGNSGKAANAASSRGRSSMGGGGGRRGR
jgi:Protein of unknown function (DUF3300)